MSYGGVYTPQPLSHSISSRSGYPTPRTPGPGFDDYSRYPYGEPEYDNDAADYAGYEDDVSAISLISLRPSRVILTLSSQYRSPSTRPYPASRSNSYYGGGSEFHLGMMRVGRSD